MKFTRYNISLLTRIIISIVVIFLLFQQAAAFADRVYKDSAFLYQALDRGQEPDVSGLEREPVFHVWSYVIPILKEKLL